MATLSENLPNVCIRNIVLDNKKESESQFRITLDVVVKGSSLESEDIPWIEDDFLLKYLKVVVVKSSNKDFNNAVNNGSIMITASTINQYSLEPGDIVLKEMPLKTKMKELREKNSFDMNEAVYTMYFEQKAPTVDDVPILDSLNIYAMTQINIYDISANFYADLSISGMSNYCGPIASESIIRDGGLVNRSNIMQMSNGEYYYGPYHQHPDGGFMVGSKHSSQPHQSLQAVSVPNIKLKDNRMRQHTRKKIANQITTPVRLFGDIYLGTNSFGSTVGYFNVNIGNIIISKTKYGRNLVNVDPKLLDQIVSNFRIKNVKIVKKLIKQSNNTKKPSKYLSSHNLIESRDNIGSPTLINRMKIKSINGLDHRGEMHLKTNSFIIDEFEDLDGILQSMEDYREISFIKEELMAGNDVRSFSFVDNEPKTFMTKKYVYEAQLSFYDSSIKVMQNILKEIKESIKDLERYINFSMLRKNYDYKAKKLKKEYVDNLPNIFSDSQTFPWVKSPAVYARYYGLLNDITPSEREAMAITYNKFLDPISFQPTTAKLFLKRIKDFANSFMKYFNIKDTKLQNMTAKRSQSVYQNVDSTDIFVQHEWSDVFETSRDQPGFEYIVGDNISDSFTGNTIGQISIITSQQLIDRLTFEESRFSNYRMTVRNQSRLGANNFTPYLAPLSFKDENGKIHDLSSAGKKTFEKLLKSGLQYADILDFSPVSMPNIPVTFVPPPVATEDVPTHSVPTESPEKDYVRARDYIGQRFGVVRTDEKFEEYSESIISRFGPEYELPTVNYDYQQEAMTPIQITQEVNSPHEVYFDSIETSELNVAQRNLWAALKYNIQVVQYKTSRGWRIFRSSRMDQFQGDVLFRLYGYYARRSSHAPDDLYDPYNKYFIVRFPTPQTTVSQELSLEQIIEGQSTVSDINPDFLISNIIVQPESRSSVAGDYNYNNGPSPTVYGTTMGDVAAVEPMYGEPQSINTRDYEGLVAEADMPAVLQVDTPTPSSQMATVDSSPMGSSGGSYGY